MGYGIAVQPLLQFNTRFGTLPSLAQLIVQFSRLLGAHTHAIHWVVCSILQPHLPRILPPFILPTITPCPIHSVIFQLNPHHLSSAVAVHSTMPQILTPPTSAGRLPC